MFILALDGGGIRGAYSSRLLQRLELSFPTLITGADLVAGTSTAHRHLSPGKQRGAAVVATMPRVARPSGDNAVFRPRGAEGPRKSAPPPSAPLGFSAHRARAH